MACVTVHINPSILLLSLGYAQYLLNGAHLAHGHDRGRRAAPYIGLGIFKTLLHVVLVRLAVRVRGRRAAPD